MADIDYKQQDIKAVKAYLEKFPEGVDVDDIIENSGANRLRVYPILIEMFFDQKLEVLKESELGSFLRVKVK